MKGYPILSVLALALMLVLTACGLPALRTSEEPSAVAEEGRAKAFTKQSLVPDTPYYSTAKSKHLASQYETNLQNLLVQIVSNPATETLQFADTNLSIKSIGFFSHATAKSPDERYLEVIVSVPNVFDEKVNFSSKLRFLFSRYASALLSILSSDTDISNDKLVAGYGLNFSWRTTSGSRINLERGVIYLPKDQAQKLLSGQISQEEVLSGAAIYAVRAGEPATQVQYTQPAPGLKLELQPREVEGSKLSRSDVKESDLPSPSGAKAEGKRPEVVSVPLETVAGSKPSRSDVKESGLPSPSGAKAEGKRPEVVSVPSETVKDKRPPAKDLKAKRPVETKILRGYVVQLSLTKLAEAEHWSSMFERDGYSTSIRMVGENGPVHLRVAGFSSYAEGNRFLIDVGKKNLKGYVLFAP